MVSLITMQWIKQQPHTCFRKISIRLNPKGALCTLFPAADEVVISLKSNFALMKLTKGSN